MCPKEIYSIVHIYQFLSEVFPIHCGLKQGDVLLPLLFNFALECAINARFLERKICNPLVNVADRLKKLRGCGKSYLVIVKIVLM